MKIFTIIAILYSLFIVRKSMIKQLLLGRLSQCSWLLLPCSLLPGAVWFHTKLALAWAQPLERKGSAVVQVSGLIAGLAVTRPRDYMYCIAGKISWCQISWSDSLQSCCSFIFTRRRVLHCSVRTVVSFVGIIFKDARKQ